MADYDLNKVSPRPWRIIDETGATFDAKGEIIFDPSNVPGNPETYLEYGGGYHGDEERARADTLHRIFCVNNHDMLVEALGEITGLVLTGIGYTDWKEVRNAEYYELKDKAIEARDGLLVAAKVRAAHATVPHAVTQSNTVPAFRAIR